MHLLKYIQYDCVYSTHPLRKRQAKEVGATAVWLGGVEVWTGHWSFA